MIDETGFSYSSVGSALNRLWTKGLLLRTEEPIHRFARRFRGRAGVGQNVRSFYLYVLAPNGKEEVFLEGRKFVKREDEYVDRRGTRVDSKSQLILEFIKENSDHSFYSTEIVEALKDRGVKPSDVTANVRKTFEKEGLLYVKGYRSGTRETPFAEGYLKTWMDQARPREEAIIEAVQKTDDKLAEKASASPTVERIHRMCG